MKKCTKDKPPHYGHHPPYAAVCFFPRQAGRPDKGNCLEREYAGRLIGRKAKNFRGDFDIFALHLCLLNISRPGSYQYAFEIHQCMNESRLPFAMRHVTQSGASVSMTRAYACAEAHH